MTDPATTEGGKRTLDSTKPNIYQEKPFVPESHKEPAESQKHRI